MIFLGPLYTKSDIERVKSLAGSGAYILAVDGGADLARLADIRVDYYIGDGDSASPSGLEYVRDVEGIRLPVKKDTTDFGVACAYASEKGVLHLTCLGFVGGRFDHQLALLGEAAQFDLDVDFLGEGSDIFLRGEDRTIAMDGYETFSVIALTENNTVTIRGGEWGLDQQTLAPLTSHGLSNTGNATIHIHEGRFVVVGYR